MPLWSRLGAYPLWLAFAVYWMMCVALVSGFIGTRYEIYWNSTNPMFHSNNSDHIINVYEGDYFDIYCPYYEDDSVEWEYYIIYMVNRSNYEQCVINDTRKWTRILTCSKPNTTVFYTLYILQFQSIPGNPDLHTGNSYYFISTSGGQRSNMNNQYQGACKTHRMRMVLRVLDSDGSTPRATTQKPATTHSPSQTPSRTTTTSTTTTTTTTTTTVKSTSSTTAKTTRRPGSGGFPGDNVIHVGGGDKNEGTITDGGAPCRPPARTTLLTALASSALTLLYTAVYLR